MVLDFVFIFVFLMACITGFKRGFTATALSFSAFLISIIATYFLCSIVYNCVIEEEFGKKLEMNVTEYISDKFEDTTENGAESIKLPAFIKKEINKENSPVNAVAQKTVKLILSAATLLISYLLIRLAIYIAKKFLHSVTSLPVIHQTDIITGLVFGMLIGIIRCAILYILMGLVTVIPNLNYLENQYYSSVVVTLISDFIT